MKNLKIKKLFALVLASTLLSPMLCTHVSAAESEKVIVIDPGCQKSANTKKEPIGPGSLKTVPQAPSGEKGTDSGYQEYELNLKIATQLKDILAPQGYDVILTRTDNDVDISGSGRAMIANTAEADIFVVIETGDNENISVICQTESNPYSYGNYNDSRLLSDAIIGSAAQTIGGGQVIESDGRAIINWAAMPTAIVQVGSLTDPETESKLITEEYQSQLAQAIADGIASYYSQK